MKKRILVIFLAIIVLAGNLSAYYSLANSGKRGLHLNSIESILRQREEQIDIATAALLLSRDWGTKKGLRTYRAKIDQMARDIIDTAREQDIELDYHVIPVINKYLFKELKFTPVDTADNPEDIFLHIVIDNKRGYCLSLSVLYLSIAERIGLPMYGVVVPGHFFVRYDDGENRFNIETTSNGNTAPDKHYIKKFKVPDYENSIYMNNLTTVQTLGCFFNNLGNSYNAIGELDYARIELERAVNCAPNLAEARTNLGNVYLSMGLLDAAVTQYGYAIELLPTDPKPHNNLANAYSQLGMHSDAEKEYLTAIELKSDFADLLLIRIR